MKLRILGIIALTGLAGLVCSQVPNDTQGQESSVVTPRKPTSETGLKDLLEGNARYAGGQSINQQDDPARLQEILDGQDAKVFITLCGDSRVPDGRRMFDQPEGYIFSHRVAGNIATRGTESLGTLQYPLHKLHAKILIFAGHTNCGALTAAVGGHETGAEHLDGLLGHFASSVVATKHHGAEQVTKAIEHIVVAQIHELQADAQLLRTEDLDRGVTLVAGVYDLATRRFRVLETVTSDQIREWRSSHHPK